MAQVPSLEWAAEDATDEPSCASNASSRDGHSGRDAGSPADSACPALALQVSRREDGAGEQWSDGVRVHVPHSAVTRGGRFVDAEELWPLLAQACQCAEQHVQHVRWWNVAADPPAWLPMEADDRLRVPARAVEPATASMAQEVEDEEEDDGDDAVPVVRLRVVIRVPPTLPGFDVCHRDADAVPDDRGKAEAESSDGEEGDHDGDERDVLREQVSLVAWDGPPQDSVRVQYAAEAKKGSRINRSRRRKPLIWGTFCGVPMGLTSVKGTRGTLVEIHCGADFVLMRNEEGSIYFLGAPENGTWDTGEASLLSQSSVASPSVQGDQEGGAGSSAAPQAPPDSPMSQQHQDSVPLLRARPIAPQIRFDAIACGLRHMAGVAGGKGWTWGYGADGALGLGNLETHEEPTPVAGTDAITLAKVTAGNDFTVFLTSSGSLLSAGGNAYGQLGLGHRDSSPIFCHVLLHPVPGTQCETTIESVSAGGFTVMALSVPSANGQRTAWTWGQNHMHSWKTGKLASPVLQPSPIAGARLPPDVESMQCGGQVFGALCRSGKVYMWGNRDAGGVICRNEEMTLPQHSILALRHQVITRMCVGNTHALALTTLGSLWGWGSSLMGQLGVVSEQATPPAPLPTKRRFAAISIGPTFCAAVEHSNLISTYLAMRESGLRKKDMDTLVAKLEDASVADLECIKVAGEAIQQHRELTASNRSWKDKARSKLGLKTSSTNDMLIDVQPAALVLKANVDDANTLSGSLTLTNASVDRLYFKVAAEVQLIYRVDISPGYGSLKAGQAVEIRVDILCSQAVRISSCLVVEVAATAMNRLVSAPTPLRKVVVPFNFDTTHRKGILVDYRIPCAQIELGKIIYDPPYPGSPEVREARWLSHKVTVKRWAPMSKEINSLVMAELSIINKLRHPNVVLFMGAVIEQDELQIVMEPMKCSLRRELSRFRNKPERIPFKYKLLMALDAANGLLFLHDQGIIHRDVKTANFLVNYKGTIKIADFGLSRYRPKETYEETTAYCGTSGWLAPEVLKWESVTDRSDVYSFGLCLWTISECDDPIPVKAVIERQGRDFTMRAKVKGGQLPSLGSMQHCNSAYSQLYVDCIARKPEDRPSMVQVRDRLEAMVEEQAAAEEAKRGKASGRRG